MPPSKYSLLFPADNTSRTPDGIDHVIFSAGIGGGKWQRWNEETKEYETFDGEGYTGTAEWDPSHGKDNETADDELPEATYNDIMPSIEQDDSDKENIPPTSLDFESKFTPLLNYLYRTQVIARL